MPQPLRPAPPRRRVALVAASVAGVFGLASLLGAAYLFWGQPRDEARPEPVQEKPKDIAATPIVKREKTDQPRPKPPDETVALTGPLIDAINRQRQQEGVPAVTMHDEHRQGCLDHARHLAGLADATEAGRQAARFAHVTRLPPDKAVQAWLVAPVHRSLLLDPRFRSVGIGIATSPNGDTVGVFDFVRGGPEHDAPRGRDPVLFPASRQTDVPLAFPGNEIPDPLPLAEDKLAGYPITVTFPPTARVHDARGWLEDEAGTDVPAWLSTPSRPANDRHPRDQQNTICLMAKQILRPATRYAVSVEAMVDGKGWSRTWTFATQPADGWQRRIRDHVLPRLNLHRRIAGLGPATLDAGFTQGCIAHARYLTRNVGRVEGLRLNEEKADLPGFSEEGRRIARSTANFQGLGVEPAGIVEQMLSTVRFRPMVLNPHERRVGMGCDLHAPGGWFWVLYLPPVPTRGQGANVVLYPGPGQREVPTLLGEPGTTFGKEGEAPAGFPVTASFSLSRNVRDAKATLRGPDGMEVPCALSTPEKPLPGVGPFRQVALVPKGPLREATTYTATVTADVDGEPWARTWSFTTVDPKQEERRVAELLLRRLNAARALAKLGTVTLDDRLSRGCHAHAAYVVRNLANPKVAGLGIHDEDPSLPGYTREGARAGNVSVIALAPDPTESVDSWLATLYHRLPLLDPRVRRIGYGQAFHPTRGWATVLDASGR